MIIDNKDRKDYTLEEKIDSIIDGGLQCEICIHNIDCTSASVILGPNGPIYSPCFDMSLDNWVTDDKDIIQEVFDK